MSEPAETPPTDPRIEAKEGSGLVVGIRGNRLEQRGWLLAGAGDACTREDSRVESCVPHVGALAEGTGPAAPKCALLTKKS